MNARGFTEQPISMETARFRRGLSLLASLEPAVINGIYSGIRLGREQWMELYPGDPNSQPGGLFTVAQLGDYLLPALLTPGLHYTAQQRFALRLRQVKGQWLLEVKSRLDKPGRIHPAAADVLPHQLIREKTTTSGKRPALVPLLPHPKKAASTHGFPHAITDNPALPAGGKWMLEWTGLPEEDSGLFEFQGKTAQEQQTLFEFWKLAHVAGFGGETEACLDRWSRETDYAALPAAQRIPLVRMLSLLGRRYVIIPGDEKATKNMEKPDTSFTENTVEFTPEIDEVSPEGSEETDERFPDDDVPVAETAVAEEQCPVEAAAIKEPVGSSVQTDESQVSPVEEREDSISASFSEEEVPQDSDPVFALEKATAESENTTTNPDSDFTGEAFEAEEIRDIVLLPQEDLVGDDLAAAEPSVTVSEEAESANQETIFIVQENVTDVSAQSLLTDEPDKDDFSAAETDAAEPVITTETPDSAIPVDIDPGTTPNPVETIVSEDAVSESTNAAEEEGLNDDELLELLIAKEEADKAVAAQLLSFSPEVPDEDAVAHTSSDISPIIEEREGAKPAADADPSTPINPPAPVTDERGVRQKVRILTVSSHGPDTFYKDGKTPAEAAAIHKVMMLMARTVGVGNFMPRHYRLTQLNDYVLTDADLKLLLDNLVLLGYEYMLED